MDKDSVARLDELFVAALRDLLDAHEVAVEIDPGPRAERVGHEVACSIGFTAPQMRGFILLAVKREFLRTTYPAGDGTVLDTQAVSDWAGEFSNELLGRVKNKLLRRGITIALGVPSVVTGSELSHTVARLPVALAHSFQTSVGPGYAAIEAEVAGPLILPDVENEDSIGVSEGEIQLL